MCDVSNLYLRCFIHKNIFFCVIQHKELCKYGLHVGILKQILVLVVRSLQHVRQQHLRR